MSGFHPTGIDQSTTSPATGPEDISLTPTNEQERSDSPELTTEDDSPEVIRTTWTEQIPLLTILRSDDETLEQLRLNKFITTLPIVELPVFLNLDERDKECTVCKTEYYITSDKGPLAFYFRREAPLTLPCGHVMGQSCFRKWLLFNRSCAVCRAKVPGLDVRTCCIRTAGMIMLSKHTKDSKLPTWEQFTSWLRLQPFHTPHAEGELQGFEDALIVTDGSWLGCLWRNYFERH